MNKTLYNDKIDTSVCFTGHRPAKLIPAYVPKSIAYTEKHYQIMQKQLQNILTDMFYKNHIDTFITGGAQGFDQIVFWTVNIMKMSLPVRNVLYLPFKDQESRWLQNGLFGQTQYQMMIRRADEVQYCTDLTQATDSSQIYQALQYRNKCMIRNSSAIIALLHKTENTPTGCTGNAVRFAAQIQKPVMTLNYEFESNNQIVITDIQNQL